MLEKPKPGINAFSNITEDKKSGNKCNEGEHAKEEFWHLLRDSSSFSDEERKRLLNIPKMLVSELSMNLIERETEAALIVLSLIMKEHVIFVGEPGTAKSELAQKASELLIAKFYKHQLHEQMSAEELWGDINIKELKKGRRKYETSNMLPEAEIAFLDEVFNAHKSLLHTVLEVLNERKLKKGCYDPRKNPEGKAPLHTVIAATNVVPEDPNINAFYDRILFRHFIKPVGKDKWKDLHDITIRKEHGAGYANKRGIATLEDMKKLFSLSGEVDYSEVYDKLLEIEEELEMRHIHISDRRRGKLLKAVQANAIMHGRDKAIKDDLLVLLYVVPANEEEYYKTEIVLYDLLKLPQWYIQELNYMHSHFENVEGEILKDNYPAKKKELNAWLEDIDAYEKKLSDMENDNLGNAEVTELVQKNRGYIEGLKERINGALKDKYDVYGNKK